MLRVSLPLPLPPTRTAVEVEGSPVMSSLKVTVIESVAANLPSVVAPVSLSETETGTGAALSVGASPVEEAAWLPTGARRRGGGGVELTGREPTDVSAAPAPSVIARLARFELAAIVRAP